MVVYHIILGYECMPEIREQIKCLPDDLRPLVILGDADCIPERWFIGVSILNRGEGGIGDWFGPWPHDTLATLGRVANTLGLNGTVMVAEVMVEDDDR